MTTKPTTPIKLFYSYANSRKDEKLRDELEKHLSSLKHQGYISGWNRREILAGKEWEKEIDEHLNTARIILLLVSPDFMASDYCYGFEVKRAMERHDAGEAHVIPILLRPTAGWQNAPFSKLQALPGNGNPITKWRDADEAFSHVAQEIRRAIDSLSLEKPAASTGSHTQQSSSSPTTHVENIQGLERPATAFLSYAREDAEEIKYLQQQLKVRGVRAWKDATGLPPGDSRIVHAIRHESDAFVVYVTKNSLAPHSMWTIAIPAALERWEQDLTFNILLVLSGVTTDELEQFSIEHGYRSLKDFEEITLSDSIVGEVDSLFNKQLRTIARRILEAALNGRLLRVGSDHNHKHEPYLCFHTHPSDPSVDSLDLDLDWTEWFPSKDELPTKEVCEGMLLPALDDVKKILSMKRLSHTLHIFLQAHIPAAIAFGASIPAVAGFTLLTDARVDGRHDTWSTEGSVSTREPLPYTVEVQNGDSNVAVIEIGIPSPIASDVARNIQLMRISYKHHIRYELPEGSDHHSGVKDSAQALAISLQIGRELRRLYGQEGVTHVHLFAAIPAALAVMIGHQINAMSAITLYHFKIKDRLYVPLCTLG